MSLTKIILILVGLFAIYIIATFADPYYRCNTYKVGEMPSYCLSTMNK